MVPSLLMICIVPRSTISKDMMPKSLIHKPCHLTNFLRLLRRCGGIARFSTHIAECFGVCKISSLAFKSLLHQFFTLVYFAVLLLLTLAAVTCFLSLTSVLPGYSVQIYDMPASQSIRFHSRSRLYLGVLISSASLRVKFGSSDSPRSGFHFYAPEVAQSDVRGL